MYSKQDELFMRRALDLAEQGRGYVSPNPMVGSVIVGTDGQIIGEGFHHNFGGPHAEVHAIRSVKDESLLNGATIYVTLEPCAHYGKTPPCADLIIKYPFKRAVICNVDSNPLVAGKGIQRMKDKGIEVIHGVLEKEGRELNKRFFTFIEKKRPYVILKWAQTMDDFIARKNYSSKWISSSLSRKLVHQWRSEEQAIMVGTNTVQYDNPVLNVRDWRGKNPLRIFIDKQLKFGKETHLLDQLQPTICYNLKRNESLDNLEYVKMDENKDMLEFILADLYSKNIQSLIVEGGSTLLQLFIEQKLWDEARVFVSDTNFTEGISAPELTGIIVHKEIIESDELFIFQPF